ncbi:MAG: hypothetical protein U1D41_08015 [Nitrosomonas sp.]|uniref:hypothetical protein n=2 Tax=Nitrosomonas sp. TaxID=42353 RepID=UPI00273386D2|nr:hypothetical protein [Nitrosomonas sp.]MDP3664140.1 hypothetical protein [Nitrosomonas sp.]MDZ4106092.1 hypothetical protein [Nitrosomonas sp.]
MRSFICHTLMMLEDIGMSVRYPDIRHVTFSGDGSRTVHMSFQDIIGTRVSIEQNQPMKFMMMFTLLDFYIDSNHAGLEGNSFAHKYRNLPSEGDYDLMLRELFRIAKVIRNSLVHNPSSFRVHDGVLDVRYEFKGTDFGVTMSADSLSNFYTSLVMYVKGDLGQGNYFLGIMRSIYMSIANGISYFSDEFGGLPNTPSSGLKIKPYVREVFMNPEYVLKDDHVQINITERNAPEWQGIDFYLEHNREKILVPEEAFGPELTIHIADLLNDWKYESSLPPIRQNL